MEQVKVLDGLRAVAVLIVIVSHAGLGHIVPGGFGVTLFFFLSGFLITTLMVIEVDKTERLDFGGFYLRRTVRIIPPMLLCIAFALFLAAAGLLLRPIRPEGLVWDFLFLTNYAHMLGVNSGLPIPLWSLAVEEHFYLLFPTLFMLTWYWRGMKGVALTVAALIALVLVVRIVLVWNDWSVYQIYYWSHTRADSILFGSLLALFNNPITKGRAYIDGSAKWFALGIVLLLVTFLFREQWFRDTIRYSLQGVALFLVFNYLLRAENLLTRVLSTTPLKIVANYSYVLYLIHVPMLQAAVILLDGAWMPLRVLAGIAASFIFAALSFRYLESPLLAWRKGFAKRLALAKELRPKGPE